MIFHQFFLFLLHRPTVLQQPLHNLQFALTYTHHLVIPHPRGYWASLVVVRRQTGTGCRKRNVG